MANTHMKRGSTSLVIREMQIKARMRYHFTPSRMRMEKPDNTTICRDVENSEHAYFAKWYSRFGKLAGHTYALSPGRFTPRHKPDRKIHPYSPKHMAECSRAALVPTAQWRVLKQDTHQHLPQKNGCVSGHTQQHKHMHGGSHQRRGRTA